MENLYHLKKKYKREKLRKIIVFLSKNVNLINEFDFGDLYDEILEYIITTIKKFIILIKMGNLSVNEKEHEIKKWNNDIKLIFINYIKFGIKSVIRFLILKYKINIDEYYPPGNPNEIYIPHHAAYTQSSLTCYSEFINSNRELVKIDNIRLSGGRGKKFTIKFYTQVDEVTFSNMRVDNLHIVGPIPRSIKWENYSGVEIGTAMNIIYEN